MVPRGRILTSERCKVFQILDDAELLVRAPPLQNISRWCSAAESKTECPVSRSFRPTASRQRPLRRSAALPMVLSSRLCPSGFSIVIGSSCSPQGGHFARTCHSTAPVPAPNLCSAAFLDDRIDINIARIHSYHNKFLLSGESCGRIDTKPKPIIYPQIAEYREMIVFLTALKRAN